MLMTSRLGAGLCLLSKPRFHLTHTAVSLPLPYRDSVITVEIQRSPAIQPDFLLLLSTDIHAIIGLTLSSSTGLLTPSSRDIALHRCVYVLSHLHPCLPGLDCASATLIQLLPTALCFSALQPSPCSCTCLLLLSCEWIFCLK